MIPTRMKRALGVLIAAGALTALAAAPALAATPPPTPTPGANGVWTGLQDPGAKATAPQTDLVNHPKGSLQSKPQPPTAHAADGAQIVTSTPSADGKTVNVGIYDPAPGFTTEQLVANLKASGAKNVQVVKPTTAAPGGLQAAVVNPNECSYGVATAFYETQICPIPLQWQNEGFANPHVRYNDHTGAAWPTNTAVYDWNTANGVNSYYLYNSCPFQAGARCVDVSEVNQGSPGQPLYGFDGYTNMRYYLSGHAFVDNAVNIQLNDFYANQNHYSAAQHRAIVEHEMGHSLGLGHATVTNDLMYSCAACQSAVQGSPDDFTFLANLYSIVR